MSTGMDRLRSIRDRNQQENDDSGNKVFKHKNLVDGSNVFRMVGDINVFFEHWFYSADGKPVHSICTRDYDAESEGEPRKYCRVCKMYKEAWDINKNPDGFDVETLNYAKVILGKNKMDGAKFASSWRAREFAYFNVIDRDDDWCVENKHTKVLSKADSQTGITAGKNGILDKIIEISEEYGDPMDYDLKIKRNGVGQDTKYTCYKTKDVDLTDVEKCYEQYNFKDLVKPTDDETLLKWLEKGTNVSGEGNVETSMVTGAVSNMRSKDAKKEKFKVKSEPDVKDEDVEQPFTGNVKDLVDEVEKADCPNPECDNELPIDSSSCTKCGVEFDGLDE